MSEKIRQLFFIGQKEAFEGGYGTQMEIMKSSLILQDVVKKLGLSSKTKRALRDSIKSVRSSISVSKVEFASIIEVKAAHPSAEMAIKMANAVYETYADFNAKLFLEQEQIRLISMQEQARFIREQMGKSSDLISERIKGDTYLLLMEKIAETRLNISLGQSNLIKVIDKAEEAFLLPTDQTFKICLKTIIGLFLSVVVALGIDMISSRKKKGV